MSIQQLEANVRSLSEEELAKFAGWFDAYLATTGLAEEENDEAALSTDQREEVDRRLDALDAGSVDDGAVGGDEGEGAGTTR